MRGSFLHNRVMLDRIAARYLARGAIVRRECPTRDGRDTGYVDLCIDEDGRRWVYEAELGPQRVPNGLTKARELGANVLTFVAPNGSVLSRIRRALRQMGDTHGLTVRVLTLGALLKELDGPTDSQGHGNGG